jgi:hypothetical protein
MRMFIRFVHSFYLALDAKLAALEKEANVPIKEEKV